MKGVPRAFNLEGYVLAVLRRASYRTPMYAEALKKARVSRNTYKCAICGHFKERSEIQRDHISPIRPITGFDSWDALIKRLFLGELQVLCKPCHKTKTQAENKLRREHKTKLKPKKRKRK